MRAEQAVAAGAMRRSGQSGAESGFPQDNVFNEQVRYAWHGALQDLKHAAGDVSDGDGDRHFVDPAKRVLHGLQKRQHRGVAVLSHAANHCLSGKTLDDDAAARVVGQLQAEQGVEG